MPFYPRINKKLDYYETGGGAGNTGSISAGTTKATLGELVFSNSNGVSFGINGQTITASHNGAPDGLNRISAGTQLAGTMATVVFSNSNGVSFGMSNSSVITASHNGLTNIRVSAGTASNFLSAVTFSNSNNVSFGLNGSVITASASHNQTIPDQYWSAMGNTLPGYAPDLTFNNNNISFNFLGNASGGFDTAGLNISVLGGAGMISAGGTDTPVGTVHFGDSNNVSFGLLGETLTASAQINIAGGTTNYSGSAFTFQDGGGIVWGMDGASISATHNGLTNIRVSAGTTSDYLSAITFSNLNGVSFGLNGSVVTASVGAAGGGATISSYENMPGMAQTNAVVFGATSLSTAVAFDMPQAGSFSFLRIPVLMSNFSTTIATIASATATAQMGQSSTYNAVAYSLGTGASSRSLISVASGSCTFNLSQAISITNSTQYSISQGFSAQAEGGGTTRTTQYSISNTNYSFSVAAFSEFSAVRGLDINFNNSLSAGAYWFVIGRSTSSSSAGAALSAMTGWGPRYSNHYAITQGTNISMGIMGSTNLTSGGLLGCGVFSTAGGGTTSGFNISAISSTASNPRMYFQLLRSA